MMKKFCVWFLLLWCSFGAATFSAGSDTIESSPWVGWRKAFQAYDQAEVYKNDRDYKQALLYYTRGRDYFAAIRRNFPDWNSKVVSERVALCENCIKQMREMLEQKGIKPPETSSYQPEKRSSSSSVKKMGDSDGKSSNGTQSRLYLEMQSEIDQYRQRLRKALSEVDDLQVKLRQSEARVRDVDAVLRENRLLQEKYSMLEIQLKELQEKSKGVDRERYEAQLLSLKQVNEKALARIVELEKELVKKDQEYAKSRAEVLKQRDEILKLTNEIRRLHREINLLQVKAAAAEEKKKLEFRVKELEVELAGKDKRIDQLLKLLSESTSSGNAASKALNEEIKRLQSEIVQLRRNAALESDLRRRISDLTAAESQLQKELAKASERIRLQNIEVQSHKINEEKLQHEITTLKNRYNALQEKDLVLQKEIQDAARRYAELEIRYRDRIKSDSLTAEKLNAEKMSLQRDLAKLKLESSRLNADLAKLARQKSADEQLLKESRQTIIDLTAKVQSMEIELNKMKEVQKAYDELKAKFELYNKAANSNDVMGALNRIPGLEEAIRRYEKENQQLINQIAALKQMQLKYDTRIAAAEQRAAAANQLTVAANQLAVEADKRADAAEAKVRELEKQMQLLLAAAKEQPQIEDIRRKYEKMQQEYNAKIAAADKRAAAAEARVRDLEKQIGLLQNEVKKQPQIEVVRQQYEKMQQEYNAKIAAADKRAAAAEAQNRELEKQIELLQNAVKEKLGNDDKKLVRKIQQDCDRKIAEANKRAAAAEAKVKELASSVQRLQAAAEKQPRADVIREQYEKMQQEYNAKIAAADKRAAAAEAKVKELASSVQRLQAAAEKQSSADAEQKQEKMQQEYNARIAAANKRAAAAEARVQELEKRVQLLIAAAKLQTGQKGKTQSRDKSDVEVKPQDKAPVQVPIVEPERIESFLADGREAEKRGNYEIAKWDYRQVLMRDPKNVTAVTRMGFINYKEGEFAAAVKLLPAVVDAKKSDEELVHALARSFIGVRNYSDALKLLQQYKARRQGRVNAKMLLAEAVAWSRSGKNTQAEKAFKMVVELDPDNAEAPYELALMLSADKNRLREAGEFYRLAKANGVDIDSYLEEVLSGVNGSAASRDFLLNNMREALEKNDMVSAAWYLDEAGKLVRNDFEVELMRNVYNLLDNKSAVVIKRLTGCTDNRQKFLLALAYLKNSRHSEAAALIQRLPVMLKTALPAEVIRTYIKKQSASGSAATRKLYNELLRRLP